MGYWLGTTKMPILKVGNIPEGNYFEVGSDGSAIRHGDATMWDDLVGSLIGQRLSSVVGKVDYVYTENAIKFQSGGDIAVANDRIIFNYQKPHSAKTDSEMRVHIHYEQTSTNVIEFTVQYRIQDNSSAKTTAWATVIRNTTNNAFTYTSGTLNQIMKLAEIDLSGIAISSTIQFRLARTDTTVGDVLGTFVDAHIESDMLGSRLEYVK